MKNKFIMLIIILMIILGAGLIQLDILFFGGAILAVGTILFVMFPLVCDFINDER